MYANKMAMQVAHMRREQRQEQRLSEEHEMLEGSCRLTKQDTLEGLAQVRHFTLNQFQWHHSLD